MELRSQQKRIKHMSVMHYIGLRTIVVKNMKCYNGNDFLALGNNVKPRK